MAPQGRSLRRAMQPRGCRPPLTKKQVGEKQFFCEPLSCSLLHI